jgi:signal transduction histidine kinase
MDSVLADILITNLLQNSIRHNVTGGSINIRTDKNSLMFSNTGDRLSISEEELFIRFKKNDASKDSLGLGLSILKSITDIYKMKIGYSYSNNRHEFRIQFPKDLL